MSVNGNNIWLAVISMITSYIQNNNYNANTMVVRVGYVLLTKFAP